MHTHARRFFAHREITAAALLGTAALVLSGCASPSASAATAPSGPTITGTATGTVKGVPDTLTMVIGIESRAPSAAAALAQNADRSNRVIGALKFSAIKPEDLQTNALAVQPSFDSRGHINGYTVSNRLTVTLHDVPNAGQYIDAAANQAGDDIRVDSLTLSIEDTSKLVSAARKDAVQAAKKQAGELASAAGVALGPIRRITEQRSDPNLAQSAARFAVDSAAASVPIEAGTQELTVDVTVVYGVSQ